MVTSTSTPGAILIEAICLTISEGLCKSMSRLWILIWKRSQVLEPSPQGVFLVVILRVLVGIRTGPFTLRFFSLAPLIRSAQTFSRDFTLRLVRVILMRWMATSGSTGVLPVSLNAMAAARLPDRLVPRRERTAVTLSADEVLAQTHRTVSDRALTAPTRGPSGAFLFCSLKGYYTWNLYQIIALTYFFGDNCAWLIPGFLWLTKDVY